MCGELLVTLFEELLAVLFDNRFHRFIDTGGAFTAGQQSLLSVDVVVGCYAHGAKNNERPQQR